MYFKCVLRSLFQVLVFEILPSTVRVFKGSFDRCI